MQSDLDEAISLARDTLTLRPRGHRHRDIALSGLAACLRAHFNCCGVLSDLDEAISFERDALALRPQGHPHRNLSLGNLAIYLHDRFIQLQAPSDLDEALDLERKAFELRQGTHPERSISMGNIAKHLYARFLQLGALSDLDEALILERGALELRPHGHRNRGASLSSTAKYLHARFTQHGMLPDLDEALALERNALELRPHGHPDRATSLANIALYLHARFEKLGALADLDDAVALERNAMELRPQGHPHRTSSLGNLASCLRARYQRSSAPDISDLQESFHLYSQLSDAPQTVSSADLRCAKQWICAAEDSKHSTTVMSYETTLHLTIQHLAILPSLPQHLALLKQLTASTAVDAFSACIRYGKHALAIELLKRGHGVFWSQLLRLRSPLDEVSESGDTGKKLKKKFMQVASLFRTVLDTDAGSQHDQACRLSIQLQDIITKIRALPGLSCFLLPPLFSDLQNAAASGPVIIVDSSQYSCDALIVLHNEDPAHVALPITKSDISQLSLELRLLTLKSKYSDRTRELSVFLRKLWDLVVSPITKTLQKFCPRGSRIWWCPTAEFSLLPLHAAGSFRKGQPMFSDLYISSYTPTLTALIRARHNPRPLDALMERHRFLVVGQAHAPNQRPLPSVNSELPTISQRIGPVTTLRLTCVQGHDATTGKVAGEFKQNEFVHLACHGIPVQKQPFESGFALADGQLRVKDIMQFDLQDARFAYLSACHTTTGDEESPDEAIHLAAAMHFAGFRSVIGTMWAVADDHTNEIVSRFYGYMQESGRLDYTRAALALHKTLRSFRASELPLD